jgi:hypothetical protein
VKTSLQVQKLEETTKQCDKVLTYISNSQKAVFEEKVRLFPISFPQVQDSSMLFSEEEAIRL